MTQSFTRNRPAHVTVLTVRLGRDVHAIPLRAVEEVLPALPIEAVPQCPSFVRGVLSLRGRLIPVFDAAERLGVAGHQRLDEPPIVCLRAGERLVGVEFDEVIDLMELRADQSLPADDVGAEVGFLSSLIEHDGEVIRLLNPDRLIARDEAKRLEQLPRAT